MTALRDKWSEALARRKDHLDEQIQKIINKVNKSDEDREREQALIDQWVQLTEERNAVKCPAAGSDIPGAPAAWTPPPAMELHTPVIFLDLNTDDLQSTGGGGGVGSLAGGDSSVIPMAGLNSILPKEHGSQFFSLPMLRSLDENSVAVGAVAAWDSSLHDSPALNRVTGANERVHVIVKAGVRLSHPAVMDVVLRKRLSLNVYKKQSLTERLRRKLMGVSGDLTSSGVTYEIVSSIPKASEDIEDRETLALVAASELSGRPSDATGDQGNELDVTSTSTQSESFIEKYTRGVSAVESILQLDRLRQEVAVKELLATGSRLATQAAMRKTASVPNFGQLFSLAPTPTTNSSRLSFGPNSGNTLTVPDTPSGGMARSDSAFDLAAGLIASSASAVYSAVAGDKTTNQSSTTAPQPAGEIVGKIRTLITKLSIH